LKQIFTLVLIGFTSLYAQNRSAFNLRSSLFSDFTESQSNVYNGPETVIWSETFGNGIPTGWSTSGTANGSANTNAVWVYRGPSTTPSNATGSRGAYAGPASTGQLPILSPTDSNGFVIFDSDYLDNNGIAGNFCGTGALACAPHYATLTTSTINLQQHSNVELRFYQYYRRFAGPGSVQSVPATYVDISTDGGGTWSNTTTLNSNLAVNLFTARNSVVSINISQFAGNQSNVKIRFRFDGEYYFWQIDDLEIVSVPKFRLTKEPIVATNKVDGKSSAFRFSQSNECNGVVNIRQVSPLILDGSVKNTGTNLLPNLKLQVKVFRNNQIDTILYSSTQATLVANSTAAFSINSGYTPTDTGVYALQYTIVSDSTSTKLDSLWFQLTKNQIGSHFNVTSNSIGTSYSATQWGTGSWVSQVFNLSPDTLVGVRIPLLVTTAASSINVQVGNNTPITHTITTTDVSNGFVYVPFSTHYPVSGSTQIKLTLNGTVNLKNDATVSMEVGRRQMYLAAVNNTFTGYSNSDAFNRIHFSLISKPAYSPTIAYTNDTLIICAGDTVNLIGSPGYSNYLWSNGATTQNLAVTTSGTYYLIVTSSSGTTDTSDYFFITVKSNPLLSCTYSGPLAFCDGGSVTINVSGAPNLIWSNGSNQNSATFNSTSSVFVLGKDVDNYCQSDTLFIVITEFSNPSVNITSNVTNNNICPGSTALLQAAGASSYVWNTNDTANTISVNSSGWYSVSGTDSNGCVATDSLFIGMNPAVVGTQIFGSSLVQPNSAQVYATQQNPGNTYVWTVSGGALVSGQNSNTISVLWGTGGTGEITLEESNGSCTSRDTFQVNISGIGLNDPDKIELTAHPNPTEGVVSLNIPLIGTYEIYTIDGRVLETGTAKKDYDLTKYPKGVYHLRLSTDEGT
jgi:hypothetical protein